MKSRAGPAGGGGRGMNCQNRFKPNTIKMTPSRLRATIVVVFMIFSFHPVVCWLFMVVYTRWAKIFSDCDGCLGERLFRPDQRCLLPLDAHHVHIGHAEEPEHCAQIGLGEIKRLHLSVRVNTAAGQHEYRVLALEQTLRAAGTVGERLSRRVNYGQSTP